ncbi:phospholipase D family protein [Shewanella sp. Isolate11]|uniref:phospholipase D family protein n=1 Tax=Shewanella sp. Isolate11 TaxID=2908530 RepID=UPI001EFCDBA4|nr:phospholipase D family protein [Shewanella sp. Isolate11]MCG9698334.1 phospholipase D family protein [Shewanella sp. Isolate11]
MFKRIFFSIVLIVELSLIGGCSTTVSETPLTSTLSPSYKIAAPADSPLYHFLRADLAAHPNQTGVLPLLSGVDAFAARIKAVQAAQQSIDLQYYIYHDDETGRLLLWSLIDAADRGVRVRVLLDDLTLDTSDQVLAQLASHSNIEIRLFNPSSLRGFGNFGLLLDFSRLNHRMHNKSLTVDNLISIVGGRNIGNEYFSKNSEVEFGDLDLLTIGNAVDKVSEQFDLYWNASVVQQVSDLVAQQQVVQESKLTLDQQTYERMAKRKQAFAGDEYLQRLKFSDFVSQLKRPHLNWYWGQAEVVFDPPEKAVDKQDQQWLLADIKRYLFQANQQLVIISPYFVPTRAGVVLLSDAVKRGIEVSVITNSLAATDVLAVHAGYQRYRQQLIENGIHIYEFKADKGKKAISWQGSSRTSLHAKTFILDNDAVFVGSFNFDPRSAQLNTEMGLLFENNAFATSILSGIQLELQDFSYRVIVENGELVWIDDKLNHRYYAEPQAGFWRKFMADFIGLLPIESQL